MNFGRIIDYKICENKIMIQFERMTGQIEIITDTIINVFAGFSSRKHCSKAIEGNKNIDTTFSVREVKKEADKIEVIVIATSSVIVRVHENFKVDFYSADGRVLCRDFCGERSILKKESSYKREMLKAEGHKTDEEDQYRFYVLKQMEGDEAFYGLGDKAGFINRRGYDYVMWNTDNPRVHTEHDKSLYKSIPFFITLRKDVVFGLFYDNPYRSVFDMGKESDQYYSYGAAGGNLDYYLITGNSMAEIVGGYTYLTGTTPLPQIWTLGYHQSRWGYMTETEVRTIAEKMRSYEIPCDVIHLDIEYMDQYKVFTWNQERYQNAEKMLSDLAADGFKVVTIIDPGVKAEEGYSVYDEGVRNNYFVRMPEGTLYKNVVWPGEAVYPDFGNREVRDWWAGNHRFLLDKGVRGIWNDMNEPAGFRGPLPMDAVFSDEEEITDHARMHNVYGHNMARAAYQGMKEGDGKRPFVISRACYAGTQKYSTTWTGDNHSIWMHLQMAIPQLCSLGLSGMSFAGTDVGGFGSDCTKELLCRWVQMGSFSPLFRNHSVMGSRFQEPWQFDEETVRIYRKAVQFRYHLIPYYYDLFFTGEKTGYPVMRPLVFHYESDPEARNCNSEFLVGEHLLAAPVVNQGERTKLVYLPEGTWYDYETGERLEGCQWIVKDVPLENCPVYVKAGTILPVWPQMNYVGEKSADKVLYLEVFPGEGSYEHYLDNGENFEYQLGAYNQYCCKLTCDGSLTIHCAHHGYDKDYEQVKVSFGGKIFQSDFNEGVCVMRLS